MVELSSMTLRLLVPSKVTLVPKLGLIVVVGGNGEEASTKLLVLEVRLSSDEGARVTVVLASIVLGVRLNSTDVCDGMRVTDVVASEILIAVGAGIVNMLDETSLRTSDDKTIGISSDLETVLWSEA